MANVDLYRGGTPEVRFMRCEGDGSLFRPPLGMRNIPITPPFDTHVAAEFAVGWFTMMYPFRFFDPDNVEIQPNLANNMRNAGFGVGDIGRLLWIPSRHSAHSLLVDVTGTDEAMAGASFSLTYETLTWEAPSTGNPDGQFVYTLTTDMDDILAAQGITNSFSLSEPSSTYISLERLMGSLTMPSQSLSVSVSGNVSLPVTDTTASGTVNLTGTATGSVAGGQMGYVMPLWVPAETWGLIGIRYDSVPTDENVSLYDMRSSVWFSMKVQGHECQVYNQ